MLRRWWLVVVVLCFFKNLYAEPVSDTTSYVSKKFLVKTYLDIKKSLPLVLTGAESEAERRFLTNIAQRDFSSLFLEPKKSEDIFTYRIQYFINKEQRASDRAYKRVEVCKNVYTFDGEKFKEVELTTIGNKVPKGYEKAWSFSYCVGEDRNADKESVLYFFHGASGLPLNFKHREAIAEVRRQWRIKDNMPRWISVSVGKLGALSDEGKMERFMEVVVPYIEGKLDEKLGSTEVTHVKNRFGLGVSLGGANVLQLLLKKPDFFTAGFCVCPAISTLDWKSEKRDLKALAARSEASFFVLYIMMNYLLSNEYKNEAYLKMVDPLYVGQNPNILGPHTPPFHIQASSNDEFGFDEGAKIFTMLAQSNGAPITFDELQGNHCVMNSTQVVDFFLQHKSL